MNVTPPFSTSRTPSPRRRIFTTIVGMALTVVLASTALADDGFDLSVRQLTPLEAKAVGGLVGRDPAAAERFAELRRRADAALSAEPSPLVAVVYEGRLDTDPERIKTKVALKDMSALGAMSDVLAVTTEPRYADGIHRYVMAWATTTKLSGNPINENKLTPLIAAYGQARDAFPEADRRTVDAWLHDLAGKQEAGKFRGNWNTKRVKLLAFIGRATGDAGLTERAVAAYRQHVASELYADGTSFDLQERDALHYHFGAVNPLLVVAASLRPTGVDLYNDVAASGASLRRSVEYVVPFADGTKTRQEWRNSTVEFDRLRAANGDAKFTPGRAFVPSEAVETLELAGQFDPELAKLAARIAAASAGQGDKAGTYSSWRAVVTAALREPPTWQR